MSADARLREALDDAIHALSGGDLIGGLAAVRVARERAVHGEPAAARTFGPQDFIPGYRVRFIELDAVCSWLVDNGWAGGIPFDRAAKAMAHPDDSEPAGALDRAWAAAEAALPDGWSLLIGDERKRGKPGWWATASEPFDEATRGYTIISSSHDGTLYATPAAALTALAARLSATPDTETGETS